MYFRKENIQFVLKMQSLRCKKVDNLLKSLKRVLFTLQKEEICNSSSLVGQLYALECLLSQPVAYLKSLIIMLHVLLFLGIFPICHSFQILSFFPNYCHFIYLSSWIAPVPSHTRRLRKLAPYLRVNCKNILVCAEQKSCLLQVLPPFFSDNFLDIFHYFIRLSRIRHSHSSFSGNIDFFQLSSQMLHT